MKKYIGVFAFGIGAIGSTLLALVWPYLSPFLLMASLPLWMIFIFLLVRALRPRD